jgi:hypothetical protein
MQSIHHPIYTYDALGRLVNYTPSGSTNDVVSQHVLLDPRIPGPRSLVSGALKPVQQQQVFNSPNSTGNPQNDIRKSMASSLYVPPLSLTSPPVTRPKTVASQLGYANVTNPEDRDIYSITTATPILDIPHDTGNKRTVR